MSAISHRIACSESVSEPIAELGAVPLSGSPGDYARLVAEETEKWGKVVKLSGAKAD